VPALRVVVMDQKLPAPLATQRVEIPRITLAPRHTAGLHVHNAPVFGSKETGPVTHQAERQPTTALEPGEAFHQPECVRITRFDTQERGVARAGVWQRRPRDGPS
jgi:hypothetical protein